MPKDEEFKQQIIDGQTFAEEQRDLQHDVTVETLNVLKKYELVFTRISSVQLMQASFMESMSLVLGEVRDIQRKQLDIEIESLRDQAREDKLRRDDGILPGSSSDSPEDDGRKGHDPKKPGDFLDAFLPGLGTFVGTILGSGTLLSFVSKGALGLLAGTLLTPVRDFVSGAVTGVLEGFGVSPETTTEFRGELDSAVKHGIMAAFFGKKKAIATVFGSIIGSTIFNALDANEDGIVEAFGMSFTKDDIANIGAVLGFAFGAFIPKILIRVLPKILAAIGVGQIIRGAVQGAAGAVTAGVRSAAPAILAGGKSFLSGAKSVLGTAAKTAVRLGGPLTLVQGMLAMSDPGQQNLDLGMRELPDDATPEQFAAWQMEGERRAESLNVDMKAVNQEFDAIEEMNAQIRNANAARMREIDRLRQITMEDIAMGSFVAPHMMTGELINQGGMTAKIEPDQAERIRVLQERNREMSRITTIERSGKEVGAANFISAPTNVGPTTNVVNNNSSTTVIQKTDPSRSLMTRPHNVPR